MKKIGYIFALILALGLTACQPTIDASSKESLKQSIDEIYESLEGEEKKDFKRTAKGFMLVTVFLTKSKRKQVFDKVDGLTDRKSVV